MKSSFFLSLFIIVFFTTHAQKTTLADGNWSKQYIFLKNTPEAEAMIRIGDIDNLGFGWAEGFNPFSGRSTDSHDFPWAIKKEDARGTDKIMVPSSYKYGDGASHDGYAGQTDRPDNHPTAIAIPVKELAGITIKNAILQLFIDDFQSPEFNEKFQVKLNDTRFIEAEKIINNINQTGPVGKLVTIRLSEEFLPMLKADSLILLIDDPTSGQGDGYAIDFVKLLINYKVVLYKGNISGKIIDEETRKPIAGATAEVKEYGSVTTNAQGLFLLKDVPAGLDIVTGSATGYAAVQKQVDVIENETTEEVLLELKQSGKVAYNDKALQEGDNLVMNNIQFEVNKAVLLSAGKQELETLAALMKENPTVEILLSGHTSSEGASTLNRELSLKRVRSCKDYLISKGIDEGRITIKGFGPDKPIAPNDNETNRAKNRRVEMKITKL